MKALPTSLLSKLKRRAKTRVQRSFFCQKVANRFLKSSFVKRTYHVLYKACLRSIASALVKWSFSNLLLISAKISLHIGCLFFVVSAMRDSLPLYSVVPQIYVLHGGFLVHVTCSFCNFFLSPGFATLPAVLPLPFVKEVPFATPPFVKEADFFVQYFFLPAGFFC